MIVFSLAPGFLHQRFPYTRASLLGRPDVDVAIDKQAALTQEVLLFDSQSAGDASLKPAGVSDTFPSLADKAPTVTLPSATTIKPGANFFSTKIGQLILSMTIGLALVSMLIILAPSIYYQVFPADTQPVEALEAGTARGGSFTEEDTAAEVEEFPLPPQDSTLPTGMWLSIPKIGVRTQLDPTLTTEEALNKGVWIAPDYGMPGDRTQPVILAAHRYGWQWWWQTDYWKYHSFYLLPDLQPGDVVEVISDQRKYYYEIYAGEEGDVITDYTADMILYTCKFLNSPVRHWRYARLVDMTKDTQS